ncbi:TPA: 50S ribosomal protein L10 [Candidatus Dependentiae bacterium]|nr:MAG: 50S ribosomal protein L10 [candidate division TM6 bacterium GW2011_GWF2_43_87]HBL98425.1 50S ribosomal protein L10 [Candidatus Dependentiae bacterium]
MNRRDKELLVESLRDKFTNSQAAFLVQVQGLTVAQLQALRRSVYRHGGEVEVAKNTLLIRATEGVAGVEELKPHFVQQIAVVFAPTDATAVARVVYETSKEHEKLVIQVGCFEGRFIDGDKVKFIATLPSREVLLAQVCGGLNAPITSYVSLLNQLMTRMLCVLKQASEKEQ